MKKELLTLIVLSLLVMGVSTMEGCPASSSQASKTGLDFSLESGLDKLSSGKTVSGGELFSVVLNIENYDTEKKTGKVCIKDNMDDIYQGIKEECIPFMVMGGEETEPKKSYLGKTSTSIEPEVTKINFPYSSEYQYSGLPATQKANMIITAEYSQSSTISSLTGISVPEPATEVIQLEQSPAPVSISVEKSITKREEGYKISLDIQLNKQSDVIVYSPDFAEENYLHLIAEMPPKTLECEPEGNYDKELFGKGLVEIKNKNFIRCSTFVYEEEQTWPLQIKLNYGVKIKKEFPFTIKAE